MPNGGKQYVSQAASATKREEYVVGGAQLSCDGSESSSARVTLNANPNTRFQVLNGLAATNMDSSIISNIIGNFGKCKKQGGAQCYLNPVPEWFNASKNVGVTTKTLVKKLSLERDTAIQVIKAEAQMSDDEWEEYLNQIHMMCTGGCIRNGLSEIGINETDIKVYKNIVSSLEEMKTNPEKNVYELSTENLEFSIALMSKVVTTIEELYNRLEQGQDAGPEDVQYLLTTNSVLVCRNGPGTISIVDNGQKAAIDKLAKIIRIRETIHVIVKPRGGDNFIRTNAPGSLDTASFVNGKVSKAINEMGAEGKTSADGTTKDYIIEDNIVIGAEDQKSDSLKFSENMYDFTGDVAEMYLKFTLDGDTVRTIGTEFQKTYSERETVDADGCGKSIQDNQNDKVIQLTRQIKTACKLGYMLYYGATATAQFTKDSADFNDAMVKHLGSAGTNWRNMYTSCNYGLWGKYYDETNGWHRGIDMRKGKGHYVHAIAPGKVVEVGKLSDGTEFYVSVYNENYGTIIYMHLDVDKSQDENGARKIAVHMPIKTADFLGTESSNGLTSANEYHTHVEFDPGEYTYESDVWNQCHGISRPWTDNLTVKLKDLIPGRTFSCNPYPIIERIWSERGGLE